MPSEAVLLGPFKGGMFNSAGTGEFIGDSDIYELINLEVDFDQSLANRPAISQFTWTGQTSTYTAVIGSYVTETGTRYIVIARSGQVGLLNIETGVVAVWNNAVGGAISNPSCCQWRNRLFVIGSAADPAGCGGYFENTTWVNPTAGSAGPSSTAMPRGGALWLYKERLWAVAGIDAVSNIAQLRCSEPPDANGFGTTWPGTNIMNIDQSNGQKLVFGLALANDILLFKEHSTYRFTYESDPLRFVVTAVSKTIGCPDDNCAVTYDNNTVYVLHGDDIYEIYNFNFQRISDKIGLTQVVDSDLVSGKVYGLSAYRDRLIVRYYDNVYGYNLKTGTWCRWKSDRKFSTLVIMPTAEVGLDIAFAGSASLTHLGEIYYMRDSRTFNVGTGEVFNCEVVTKTYEYDKPETFKRLWQWGISIATTGNTTCETIIPNAGQDKTWGDDEPFTWGQLANEPWGEADTIINTTIIAPDKGGYARKYYKINAACRFRRIYYRIVTEAKFNTIADACVRIYNLTTFVRGSERAKEKVS